MDIIRRILVTGAEDYLGSLLGANQLRPALPLAKKTVVKHSIGSGVAYTPCRAELCKDVGILYDFRNGKHGLVELDRRDNARIGNRL